MDIFIDILHSKHKPYSICVYIQYALSYGIYCIYIFFLFFPPIDLVKFTFAFFADYCDIKPTSAFPELLKNRYFSSCVFSFLTMHFSNNPVFVCFVNDLIV